jgi:hypothetical protein
MQQQMMYAFINVCIRIDTKLSIIVRNGIYSYAMSNKTLNPIERPRHVKNEKPH